MLFGTVTDSTGITCTSAFEEENGHSEEKTLGFDNHSGGRCRRADHRPFHVMLYLLIIFFTVRSAELAGKLPQIAASFADDLLCLPLVLGGVLWCHRRWAEHGAAYTLPRSHGLLTLVFFGIYFEAILPHWKITAVSDPIDLVMYLAGYLFFEFIMNKPKGHQPPSLSRVCLTMRARASDPKGFLRNG